jgi:hypothetical protein
MNPRDRESGPTDETAFPTIDPRREDRNTDPSGSSSDSAAVSSQQVNWWTVVEFTAPLLETVRSWPTLGTPEWCALPDDHPAKLAALLDAARHWALRVETCQQAACEASRAIAAAENWSAIAQEVRDRNEFHALFPWMKRVSA